MIKKTSPAMRLAALYLAAHSSSKCYGNLPAELPGHCRVVLPELLENGFLSELQGDKYRLHEDVRHLGAVPAVAGAASNASSAAWVDNKKE